METEFKISIEYNQSQQYSIPINTDTYVHAQCVYKLKRRHEKSQTNKCVRARRKDGRQVKREKKRERGREGEREGEEKLNERSVVSQQRGLSFLLSSSS